jgi:DNA gyrase inhibitor GyrI
LPGGLYARYRLRGHCSLIAPAFHAMQRQWLPRSGFQFDAHPARPLLERYVDDAWASCATDRPTTDLLIPVRSRTIR